MEKVTLGPGTIKIMDFQLFLQKINLKLYMYVPQLLINWAQEVFQKIFFQLTKFFDHKC